MEFRKYQHIERLGTTEVNGIEDGVCYIFPKIDGTNASVWFDKDKCVQAGSRKRHLSLESDNAGFYAWVKDNINIKELLTDFPDLRLYGEWLVPHSLKTYRETAWRDFYVFDVMVGNEYLHYNIYSDILSKYGVNYIPPICIINNPTEELLIEQTKKNSYLIQDGKGIGEGIVVKRYDFVNKYGRMTWAKVVTNEFKEKNSKEFGVNKLKPKKTTESDIVNEFVTKSLCEKTMSKIELQHGDWSSKYIGQLLGTVYYDLVREDCWNFIKKHKNPTIDFGKLQKLTFGKVKELLNL